MVVAALVLCPTGSARVPATPAGTIIFNGGPGEGLYAVDAADTTLKHVLNRGVVGARWSPDGRWLAFGRFSEGPQPWILSYELWAMRFDGRRLTRLARVGSFPWDATFDWAPDSRRLVFQADTPDFTGLAIVDVASGRVKRLTSRRGDSTPVWSPNGALVAFGRRSRDTDLWVVDPATRRERQVTFGIAVFSRPEWSPDAREIVFYPCCVTGVDIVNVGSGRVRKLVHEGVYAPAWSPDGRWIALTGGGTHLIRPDGGGMHRISDWGDDVGRAAWSPDGRALVVEGRCCSPDLWLVAADGSSERRLTEGYHYAYGSYDPLWHPRSLPIGRIAGTVVSPATPTDSFVVDRLLRATHPIARLAADGSRVAIAYGSSASAPALDGRGLEVWDVATTAPMRIRGCCAEELALAETTIATHAGPNSGGGIDSWALDLRTLDRHAYVAVSGLPCCSRPMNGLWGDGSLLVLGTWGPCRISMRPACATEPKRGGTVWRIDEGTATKIASVDGALTPTAVDGDNILVDHEDGRLEILGADGASRLVLVLPKGSVRGAKLQGRDLVVLGRRSIAQFDPRTGSLEREFPITSGARRLDDLHGGIAVYVDGATVELVRLRDGATRAIDTGGSDVLAQLEESGLFYSYTASDEV